MAPIRGLHLAAAATLLLAGCGRPGGTVAQPPDATAVETARCLREDGYDARPDLAGARLIEAELATGAVVVRFEGGTEANIFFFERDVHAERANSEATGDVKSFRDSLAVTAYSEDPSREERQSTKDCLPGGGG